MKSCIASVQKTRTYYRYKRRNRAVLRDCAALVPIVENKTRWCGKHIMIERFGNLRLPTKRFEVRELDGGCGFEIVVQSFSELLREEAPTKKQSYSVRAN